ncbi:hypothetical protein MTBBW1_2030059 [Desulfamplus magnetovallimortis]|uniref:Tyrosinase copper-binding domain-containing protein n=1 Tax=Desulfamplus magnetovallimortis TaxID=1246637 RepID=A0A1W1HBZ2_9BACT|nr:glycosyltransferase family 2 protein [Desulfamplus magnetovallimortis]SLM29969.1 hypothetical protein MTBBW1_2030059 [Desulfamplus magnetovallimortis]
MTYDGLFQGDVTGPLSVNIPLIDVVVVNYNGMPYLPDCLGSLFKTCYPSFHVIVVDNASTDDSVNWIKTHYPDVIIIENSVNEGFGRANLRGIRYAEFLREDDHQGKCFRNDPNNFLLNALRWDVFSAVRKVFPYCLRHRKGSFFKSASYFALINTDTRVEPDWLLNLVNVMESDENCASACSRLLFMDRPELINATGGGMNFLGHGYDHDIFAEARNVPVGRIVKDVFFPTAAACLVRRSAFYDVGGFDPSFFMYHEDVDLGWRFHLRGYSVKYVSDSTVYHAFGGTSMKIGSMRFRNRLGLRHALRSLLKNYEMSTLLKVMPIFFRTYISLFRAGISTGFFSALLWNLTHLPGTIIQRHRVQRRRKVSDLDMKSLILQDVQTPVNLN